MELSTELKSLVHQSVAFLGEVIKAELGAKSFARIEAIRKKMTEIRSVSYEHSFKELQKLYGNLEKLSADQQREMAQAFTLMLEVMNACENAYRSYRLMQRPPAQAIGGEKPEVIIYVLTAHPTEARSPQNISVFHEIQNLLIQVLQNNQPGKAVQFHSTQKQDLFHLLEVAWRLSVVRNRSPKVKDEAEHIYSLLFRDDILFSLLDSSDRKVPLYIRSWVGGDKDGHPGVDEKVLLQSLSLSRQKLLHVSFSQIRKVRKTLEILSLNSLLKELNRFEKELRQVRSLRKGDALKVQKLRKTMNEFRESYEETLGSLHPELRKLSQIFKAFPGLVVPLELRESSDVLMSPSSPSKPLAIERMLKLVAQISSGGDPRWYTRGFIISMTESMEHILAAAQKQKTAFGEIRLPIIPLFEEASSLAEADRIMSQMVQDKAIHRAAKKYWDSLIEMMVGYSDSSKEAGVLASRLAIAEALPKLEKVCQKAQLKPLFFHGSGGSIDRGGGSIEDQTAWWPRSALARYKVTVQGEMVERSLATPEIAHRQIEKIIESASRGMKKKSAVVHSPALVSFAEKVSASYRAQTTSPFFLEVVEAATPYSYLSVLKIGSRPAKRTAKLTVKGLRAIPWVLCWTQTRMLFQTWWGIGSAWKTLSLTERQALKKAFQKEAVFQSYIKALGFTLAKVQLAIWKTYLQHSNLSDEAKETVFEEFKNEFDATVKFLREVTGEKNLTWYRPWLGESIQLRSPMIHPLNILQILARKNQDVHLLRLTVTGIASGMLTTG